MMSGRDIASAVLSATHSLHVQAGGSDQDIWPVIAQEARIPKNLGPRIIARSDAWT